MLINNYDDNDFRQETLISYFRSLMRYHNAKTYIFAQYSMLKKMFLYRHRINIATYDLL